MKQNRLYGIMFMAALLLSWSIEAKTWHVSKNGSDTNSGSSEAPFLTISKAAFLAVAGDTVLIRGGVYREWVSPANGGISPLKRIVYMAATGEEVHLKGSEPVNNWKKQKNGLWRAEVNNAVFGDFNPFAINLYGDWLSRGKQLHLGEVYLDGKTLIETIDSKEITEKVHTWYVEVLDESTVITANFGVKNPNKSMVEINVRPTCFFPKTTGVDYITVTGLHISQAATQWSPPTGEQVGLIGPNWSKGWVIENCTVSQSKCVGICLGKSRASGQNMWSLYRRKFGYTKSGFNREIEAIFKGYYLGWSKENVGSHLIQNNTIFECGQAGIVGHMGAAFSTIRNNEIRDINRNAQIGGAETAGIKLHAAIDVVLEHNCIVNTTMGIWLDWQAQGTQVFNNIIAESDKQDLFFEVTHGPTLVYNNILLSELGMLFRGGQGIALFNNMLSGGVKAGASPERYTPYHFPHSTKVKGLFNNPGGDVRFYNNVFLGDGIKDEKLSGLVSYNRFPVFSEKLSDSVRVTPHYLKFLFPIWTGGNVYFNNAKPYDKEVDFLKVSKDANATLDKRDDGYYLTFTIARSAVKSAETLGIDTKMLGQTFISEAIFENPDSSPFRYTKDFFGKSVVVEKTLGGAIQ